MDQPGTIICEVRTCPEHLCRLFEKHVCRVPQPKDLEQAGRILGLRYVLERTRKPKPSHHWKHRLLIYNEQHFLLDDKYPKGHPRHIAFKSHCFRTDTGIIGGNEKLDPKTIIIDRFRYIQLATVDPVCEVCTDGDMIPPSERFYSSAYRPE